jgi:hypothetical protein
METLRSRNTPNISDCISNMAINIKHRKQQMETELDPTIAKFIKEYQCSGCSCGSSPSDGCFKKSTILGSGCGAHNPGTMFFGDCMNTIFLGMPTGFNRVGPMDTKSLPLFVFATPEESAEFPYDKFNVPVWKHRTTDGHTLVRGMSPRRNCPFIHVHLHDCMADIDCIEISQDEIDLMD